MQLLNVPENSNPKINLAIEEFAVRNLDVGNDYLFIYQNNPSVIIGKNQNPFEEINLSYIFKHKIELVRRISGGGAVYHGPGNINFCYITKSTRENFNNYKNFLKPIVRFLKNLDIPAEINARNDLAIEGKKISGNAQFTSREKMLSHGTLLFNADLDILGKSLIPKKVSLNSKSTKSVRSQVTNINKYLRDGLSIDQFKDQLIESFINTGHLRGEIRFNESHWAEINNLAGTKYGSWDWTWGRTPKFKIYVTSRESEKSKIELEILKGIIFSVSIEKVHPQGEVVKSLTGTKYWKSDIESCLKNNWPNLTERNKKLIADCIFPF